MWGSLIPQFLLPAGSCLTKTNLHSIPSRARTRARARARQQLPFAFFEHEYEHEYDEIGCVKITEKVYLFSDLLFY